MKQAVFTEVRNHAKQYFDIVASGEPVRVLRNGKSVAEIVQDMADLPSWKRRMAAQKPLVVAHRKTMAMTLFSGCAVRWKLKQEGCLKMNSLSGAVAITKMLFIVCIVSGAGIFSGCAGTAETTRVKLDYPHGSSAPTFRLTDVRPSERRIYRQTDSTQYLGDGNFEIPPVQVLTGYLNEKLGERLSGKEIILLEFQASITAPSFQTYPGMPIGTEALGRALRLPQLGNPHYAHVSLKVVLDQKEFTGAKSVSFQLGLGKSEIAEAMRAAIEEVIAVLQIEATNDAASPR